jgi:hypothetical protein
MFKPMDMNIFAKVNYIVLVLVFLIPLLITTSLVRVFKASSSSKAALSLRKHKSNPQSNLRYFKTASRSQYKNSLLNRLEYFPYRATDLAWMESDSLSPIEYTAHG